MSLEDVMLPDWMIEELEKDRRSRDESARPRLDLPVPQPPSAASQDREDDGERGVVTFQIL